jgi:hypothetical protein
MCFLILVIYTKLSNYFLLSSQVLVNDTRVCLDKNYQFDHVFAPETTNPQVKIIYLPLYIYFMIEAAVFDVPWTPISCEIKKSGGQKEVSRLFVFCPTYQKKISMLNFQNCCRSFCSAYVYNLPNFNLTAAPPPPPPPPPPPVPMRNLYSTVGHHATSGNIASLVLGIYLLQDNFF